MKRIISYFAMAMALTACGSDDEILNDVQRGDRHPLQFTATVEDIQTRVTSDNKWEDGDEIGVTISTDPNTIGQYALNADGTVKKVIKGVEWQGTESATVTAWYPYAERAIRINISDQRNGYTDYEILRAETEGSSAAPVNLEFKHQMAKVRCRLKATYEGRDISISGATVKFNSVFSIIVENGKVRKEENYGEITSYEDSESGVTTYTAMLPPQTVTAGTKFIKITIGDKTVYYKPAQDITLEAGKSYNYNIKIADVPDNTIDSNGTYHVYTAEGLKAWAAAVAGNKSTSCTLEANITMSGNWTPISSFEGTFDGNEHTISGLRVNETANPVGFISSLEGGTVKNLTLDNVNITGKNNPAGGVAGRCNGGTIENCHITGTGKISVTEDSHSSEIGGIVGSNTEGTILACHVSKKCSVGTTVTSGGTNIFVGGIAGTNFGGTVKGCYALCSLYGIQVGGICGSNSSSYDGKESSYIACYSNCSYNAFDYAGGILGRSSGSPTFKECYWAANILNGVGYPGNNPEGITKVTDWSSAVADEMNTALGADFGYEYVFNTDDSNEPLKLVKKQ
ncbi:MAG: fimbrillin family protein [Prevotella sp.]|nr:fimbrillin family protein [Prevotella sp.]